MQVPDGYRLVHEVAALDLDLVHRALSEDSYWAAGRERATTEQAFAASRVSGVVDANGATVAFGRAVTDGVTFGWLCDVWVEPDHRGRGLGVAVVRALTDAPALVDLRRWLLATRDAHGLYGELGFGDVEPGRMLERRGPTI